MTSSQQSQQGHLLLALVLLAVSLVLAVLVVGVVKLRANSGRQRAEEQEVEMAWDDAALNITVNPLEVSLLIACWEANVRELLSLILFKEN